MEIPIFHEMKIGKRKTRLYFGPNIDWYLEQQFLRQHKYKSH